MPWDSATIAKYHSYAQTYISSYGEKIDCADLAIASLVDFASKNSLPVKLKYYAGGWKWFQYQPGDDAVKFKNKTLTNLGALNVIDNTVSIAITQAKAGDLIMSKWSSVQGHTRIIYSVTLDAKTKESRVVWYQGNLPPVVPEKKEDDFSKIASVYGGSPRRWKFSQF